MEVMTDAKAKREKGKVKKDFSDKFKKTIKSNYLCWKAWIKRKLSLPMAAYVNGASKI